MADLPKNNLVIDPLPTGQQAEQPLPVQDSLLHDADGKLLLDAQGQFQWRKGVTPLWTFDRKAKCDAQIDSKYHNATLALASSEFFAGEWHIESKTKFLWIRDRFISACDEASAHDWQAAFEFHKLRRSLDDKAAELGKATRKFLKALQSASPLIGAPQKLAYILRCNFEDEPIEQSMTGSGTQAEALISALDGFAAKCEEKTGRGSGHFQFGPIHYHAMPTALPSKEVALALKLADLFTTWRMDDQQKKNIHLGRPPNLSSETPWKVIALFVGAALGVVTNYGGLQARVTKAVARGARIG